MKSHLFPRVACLAVVACALLAGPASAAQFPTKPIELIVGYSAGGGTHLAAELLVPGADKYLGQPIKVTCKPGAGGAIAATYAAKAKPDGYTLLYATLALPLGPHISRAGYKVTDFVGVGQCSDIAEVLAVKGDAPFNNAKEFVEYAKANPGKATWGHPGVGSSLNILGADAIFRMGIMDEVKDIPFKGTAQSSAGVLGGHITAVSTFYPAIAENLKSKDMKLIGVSGPDRLEEMPDVPTFNEQGYPAMITSWRGVFAHKDTPPEILEFLRGAFEKIIKSPEFADRANKFGEPPMYKDGPDFTQMAYEQDKVMENLVKELGLAD